MSKFLDNNGVLYLWQKVKALLSNKVDKVDGKALSTNDFTTEEKNKLAGISANANNFVLNVNQTNGLNYSTGTLSLSLATTNSSGAMNFSDKAKLDGIAVNANNYAHPTSDGNIHVPATGTSNNAKILKAGSTAGNFTWSNIDYFEITNKPTTLAGYGISDSMTSTQINSVISSAISDITQFDFQVVTTLPSTGTKGIIYLVANSGYGNNIYDEYIYVNNKWEKIGTTDIDLSDYLKTADMVALTNAEIDTLCV